MSRLPKSHFWEWFKRNNKEYLELNKKAKKEADYWMHEMTAHLRVYLRFFGFSIALPDNGSEARLTITVNGKAKYFKKVDAFVAQAPEIPGWNIIALEEPVPIDFLLEKEIEKAGIDPCELSFSINDNEQGSSDLVVYHPLCTDENGYLILDLAYAAAYNLLGERSFGLDIGYLVVENLSNTEEVEVHPLEELPIHIGSRRSAIMVDENGTLLYKG